MKAFFSLFIASMVSACSTQPITQDYGSYPSHYQQIAQQFYQGKRDITPIQYIRTSAPKMYEQKAGDYGFVVPLNPAYWATVGKEQAIKGYVICTWETNNYNGHKTDALLIHNGKVISWIYNVYQAALTYSINVCKKESEENLSILYEKTRQENIRFIKDFIKELK